MLRRAARHRFLPNFVYTQHASSLPVFANCPLPTCLSAGLLAGPLGDCAGWHDPQSILSRKEDAPPVCALLPNPCTSSGLSFALASVTTAPFLFPFCCIIDRTDPHGLLALFGSTQRSAYLLVCRPAVRCFLSFSTILRMWRTPGTHASPRSCF